MAFPSVLSITETSFPSSTGDHEVQMPATVDANDLLIIAIAMRGGGTSGTPTGWTKFHDSLGPLTSFYKRKADGTEGGTTVNISDGSVAGAAQTFRIDKNTWSGDIDDIEVSTVVEADSNSPDPGSLTASWGAENNLWLAIVGAQDDDATVSAYPTNYTNGTETLSGGGTNSSAAVYSAQRENATATEDPGTFTISESESWNALTVVIRPATNQHDATSGGLAKVTLRHFQSGDVLGGGLAQTNETAAVFVTASVIAGGLATEEREPVSPDVAANSCLLLEDNSSKLLLEDGASCLLILEGVGSITAAATAGGVTAAGRVVSLGFGDIVGGLAAVVVTQTKKFVDAAALAGGLLTRHIKANLQGIEPGPFVEAQVSTVNDTAATSHSVNLPDGSNIVGRRLIGFCAGSDFLQISWPGGWTLLPPDPFDFDESAPITVTMSLAYRDIDGSEGYPATGASINVAFDVAAVATFQVKQLTGHDATAPDVSFYTTTTDTSPNSLPLTVGSPEKGHLYMWACAWSDESITLTNPPPGYIRDITAASGISSGTALATAERDGRGSIEDPAAATLSSSVEWVAATLATSGEERLNSAAKRLAGPLTVLNRVISTSAAATSGGLAARSLALVGALVQIAAAATSGVFVGVVKTGRLTRSVIAGLLGAIGVQHLPTNLFTGGGGLGEVGNEGRGWRSWRTKSGQR